MSSRSRDTQSGVLLLSSCVKLVINEVVTYTVDVVSNKDEMSRVRPSVNHDSERIYGSIECCEAQSAIHAKYMRPRSSLKTGPARPGHVNITPVITAVSAEPFSHGPGTLQCLQKEMATYRH